MTRFHVNPETGLVYKCKAKPGNCLYGEQYHSDSEEEAQKIADEINKKIVKSGVLSIQRKPNELFINRDIDTKIIKAQNKQNAIGRDLKYKAEQNYKKLKKEGYKKSQEQYIQEVLDNDIYYQRAKENQNFLKQLGNLYLNHRLQTEKIEKDIENIIVSKSYSKASSSAYYLIKKKDIDKLELYLSEEGYKFNTNLDLLKDEDFVEIRIADHTNKRNIPYAVNIEYKKDDTTRSNNKIIKELRTRKKEG